MYGAAVAAVAVACLIAAARPEEVTVRLDGGSFPNEGTIFIKRGSEWGLVCDDDWDLRDGAVVCRQLGYKKVVKATTYNAFKSSTRSSKILLDDVKCAGFEKNIGECRHRGWGISNCHAGEAAGVVCSKEMNLDSNESSNVTTTAPEEAASSSRLATSGLRTSVPSTVSSTTTTTSATSQSGQLAPNAAPPNAAAPPQRRVTSSRTQAAEEARLHEVMNGLLMENSQQHYGTRIAGVKLVGGRSSHEGYMQLTLGDGRVGAICGDSWGIFEAAVACRHAGHPYAKQATNADFFGGVGEQKLFYELDCDGHEASLSDCSFRELGAGGVKCSKPQSIAGVVCTKAALPDLVPNVGALIATAFVQDVPLHQLECAMEEGCLSSSANGRHMSQQQHYLFGGLSSYFGGWTSTTRRLLRFASSILNNGTADFRPVQHRSAWEWHACHMHWHSMSTFTHYDVVDHNGNRVAEGHKASFCLEDVECRPGVRAKYSCRGFGEQGISIGCSDVYKQDIDCQWIDITDLKPGTYIFKLNVNPEYKVAELSFDNNAVMCELVYSGYGVKLRDCALGRG